MKYSVILMLIIALGLLVVQNYSPLAEGVPNVVAQQAPPPPPPSCDPTKDCLPPMPPPKLGG